MTTLQNYMNDGANYQARAVLGFISNFELDVEEGQREYLATIKVARWENCREQGYVLSLLNEDYKQLNIAFFEHRNSDEICAIKWIQNTINTPTIDTAEFGDVYKDKYDVSYSVRWGEIKKMGDWICDELQKHWSTKKK